MIDMNPHIKLAIRGAVLITVCAFMVGAFYPESREYVAGLLLGMFFSLINGYYLTLKMRQVSERAEKGLVKRANTGFILRAALCVMAVAIAVKKPDFNVLFTVIGLFYIYYSLAISSIMAWLRLKRN